MKGKLEKKLVVKLSISRHVKEAIEKIGGNCVIGMKDITEKLQLLLRDPALKKKTLFTLAIFLFPRIFAFLPVSVIDLAKLKLLFSQNQFLSLLDMFSGGTLINFSVMALGLNPYINASIILQLLSAIFPQLEQLAKRVNTDVLK